MRSALSVQVGAIVFVLATSACSAGGTGPSTTVTQTVQTIATVFVTPTDVRPASTATSVQSSIASSTSSPASPTLAPSTGPQKLGLEWFFEPSSDWDESRFDVADRRQAPGIGTRIDYCYQGASEVLELRLSNYFSRLTFSVGQSNDSRASDQKLIVEVIANNAQVEVRRVQFNEIQAFDIPVKGVNAMKILFYMDNQVRNCGQKPLTAVVIDPTVT